MRTKHYYAIAALTVLIALGSLPSAQALEIGAKASYWYPKVTGNLQVGTKGNSGTVMDYQKDLDINQEGVLGGMLFLNSGKHHLSVDYTQLNFDSNVTLHQNLSFAGTVYNAGQKAKAEMTWGMGGLQYGYDIAEIKPFLAGATVTLLGRLMFMDAKSRLESGAKVSQSTFQPAVPMLGASAKVQIIADLLSADLGAVLMGYSGNFIMDGTAEVSVTPLPFLGLHAGWRYFKLDAKYDETNTDSTFSGPYGYLSVSF